jgi:predicted nuclease of restriction endonuclease-like RecB superfamily
VNMSEIRSFPRVSTLLPQEVREALVKAAMITDELERRRAIEEVVERATRKYPQFFNQDEGVAP